MIEVKYPSWLAGIVLVRKALKKWRMCVDFTNLNDTCSKDPYPLPNIDLLIGRYPGYKTLTLMDIYSRKTKLKWIP